ncbi:MAG: type II toxin-antitoxin system HicB family antitoxin [Bacteroidales bacterium]|nr:type II toxin-antitoxin system HicB family antitoxin [Bacteroidales bacterium]
MEYVIIIEKNANGWYTGQCEQIPEAISEGATLDELKENMADAIKMVLDYKKEETRQHYLGRKVFRRRVAVL